MSSPTRAQQTISSYFASQPSTSLHTIHHAEKRTASSEFVDLTLDDSDVEISVKKSKTARAGSRLNRTVSPKTGAGSLLTPKGGVSSSRTNAAAGPSTLQRPLQSSVQKYCFNSTQVASDEIESEKERRAKAERREKFKQRLLGDNSLFRTGYRQTETTTDEKALHDGRGNDSEESLDDTDDDPSTLPESIRAKAFFQDKGKSSLRHKRNPQKEIGPSGKSYTPLEKQV